MNCWRAKSLFSAHLDNELGHDEAQELNEHLANCPECRGAIEELRRMKRLVGGVNYHLPERFSDSVLECCRSGRVEAEKTTRRPLVLRYRFALAAGLLVSAVGAAFLVLDFDTNADSITPVTTTNTTTLAEPATDAVAAIAVSEEITSTPEPAPQTAGNYLANHLANSEVSINSDDVISRHVVADEAIAKAAAPARMVEAEVAEEAYYSAADFSLVSAGASLPGTATGLPPLPTDDADEETKPLNLEEFFEGNLAADGE